MKKSILSLSIMAISIASAQAESVNKKLFLFKDLSSYQEKIVKTVDDSEIIEMPNTTVLKSVNYQLLSNGKRLPTSNVKIIPKSEKNIYIVNEGKKIIINDKPARLISYGPDFIKTKSDDNSFVKYTPKEKIESIMFERDIDSQSHILEIKPYNKVENAEINVSYTVGELNWEPKYILNLTDNIAVMDYVIEVDNKTNKNFNNVNLAISTDSIQRIHKDYSNGIEDYIFTVFKEAKEENKPEPYYHQAESLMMDTGARMMKSSVVSKMGKESIVFEQEINIDRKSKSLIDYDINNEFEYIKHNYARIYSTKEKQVYTPSTTIEVIREGDKDSMKLVPGVISIYADKDIYEGQLINEVNIGKVHKEQNLKLNIGDNNNIKITTKTLDSIEHDIYTEEVYRNNRNININVNANSNNISSIINDYRVYNNNVIIEKVNLKINSKIIKKGESLTFKNDYNTLIIKEKNIESLYKKIAEMSLLSKVSNIDYKNFNIEYKKIKDNYTEKELKYNENELKKGINENIYLLKIHKDFIKDVSK